jgi:hypothetical protein
LVNWTAKRASGWDRRQVEADGHLGLRVEGFPGQDEEAGFADVFGVADAAAPRAAAFDLCDQAGTKGLAAVDSDSSGLRGRFCG